eukprot:CFRG8196T1
MDIYGHSWTCVEAQVVRKRENQLHSSFIMASTLKASVTTACQQYSGYLAHTDLKQIGTLCAELESVQEQLVNLQQLLAQMEKNTEAVMDMVDPLVDQRQGLVDLYEKIDKLENFIKTVSGTVIEMEHALDMSERKHASRKEANQPPVKKNTFLSFIERAVQGGQQIAKQPLPDGPANVPVVYRTDDFF